MKIPLTVGKLFPKEERLFPLAPLVIKPSKYPFIRMPANALVDTGSGSTTIAPRDIMKTRIPYNALRPASPRHIRIGGFILPVLNLGGAALIFRDEIGENVSIETPAINVIGTSPKGEGVEHIPTIIGTDFLEDNEFALLFNPSKREAYLEK
jgi:hypothetical protein